MKKYTIQDLKDGKVILMNSSEGKCKKILKLLGVTMESDELPGMMYYYVGDNGLIGFDIIERDENGHVPLSQLKISNLIYKGTWDALNNFPLFGNNGGGGIVGEYYVVNVAGTTNIDGIFDWKIGDWIIHNGNIWEKADHTDQVSSAALS